MCGQQGSQCHSNHSSRKLSCFSSVTAWPCPDSPIGSSHGRSLLVATFLFPQRRDTGHGHGLLLVKALPTHQITISQCSPLTAFNSSHASCQSGGAASDASMSPLTTLVVHFSLVAMGTDNIMAQTQHSTKFGRTDCLCAPTAKQRPAAPFNSSLDICCQRHVGDNFPCCQIHGHVGM